MRIRKAVETEGSEIINVHTRAFGKEKDPEIGQLVTDLLEDQTAVPTLSLVAVEKGAIVGHILFFKVTDQGLRSMDDSSTVRFFSCPTRCDVARSLFSEPAIF